MRTGIRYSWSLWKRTRFAWDTDLLRAHALILTRSIARRRGTDEDPLPTIAEIKSWRVQRLCARFPEVKSAVREYVGKLQPSILSLPDSGIGGFQCTGAQREASRETIERKCIESKNIPDSAREMLAYQRRVYGKVSASSEREAEAMSALACMVLEGKDLIGRAMQWKGARFTIAIPRTGHSAPDSPYVKQSRYPKIASMRGFDGILWKMGNAEVRPQMMARWTYDTYLRDKSGAFASPRELVTMFTDFAGRWERKRGITTAADRQRQASNRAARMLSRTIAELKRRMPQLPDDVITELLKSVA